MSCPHLHPDTIAECTQAAFDYHPSCYCVFSWVYADMPPDRKYLRHPNKWLQVNAWWAMEGAPDQYLLGVNADSGPELLRSLRGALAGLGPAWPPLTPTPKERAPSRPLRPAPGNGWIPTVAQTTQPLPGWSVGYQ